MVGVVLWWVWFCGGQVMQMDSLLRSQQAEAISRRQEMDVRLAKTEEDLRTKSEENRRLSERLTTSQKVRRLLSIDLVVTILVLFLRLSKN